MCLQHTWPTFLTLNTHIRLSRSPAFVSELKISEKWCCILLHSPILLLIVYGWWVYLHENFCIGLQKMHTFMQSSAYRPFKVVQARWFWHQSKARMGLPISLSYCIVTLVLSCTVSDIVQLTGWKLQIFLSYPHVSSLFECFISIRSSQCSLPRRS